jgi:uncharacterized protein involved in exopolysaccharide biosynthesis
LLGPPVIAVLLIYLLPPVYRAQTSLVVGSGPEYLAQGDGSAVITAPTTTKQEFVNTEIELLTNPAVVEATITRVGLANLYPELLNSQLGPQLARDTAIRTFESALRVEPVKLSNVIRVTFDHGNSHMAARTLDQFVTSYQDLHAKVFAGRRASGYEERISRDTKELEHLERERAETKAAFGVFDLGQQRSALIQQRVDAERQLRQTVDRSDALSTRLAYLAQTRPNIVSEMLSSQTEPNPAATHAAEVLVDLRQKESALLTMYDPGNAMVQRLRQQIDAAQRQLSALHATTTRISLTPSPITTAIDQDLVTSQAELAPLKAQELRSRILVGTLGDDLQHLEQADTQLRLLDSRIADQNDNLRIIRQLYDKARTEDEMDRAKVTAVVQTSNALAPAQPIAPNKLLFLVGGILAGLISAAGVLVLAAITNRSFMSEESIERALALPVLGSIPMRERNQDWLV